MTKLTLPAPWANYGVDLVEDAAAAERYEKVTTARPVMVPASTRW